MAEDLCPMERCELHLLGNGECDATWTWQVRVMAEGEKCSREHYTHETCNHNRHRTTTGVQPPENASLNP